jgi:lysophospholipase L1-like esterase
MLLDPEYVRLNNLGAPATTPADRPLREGWMERHRRYCERAARGDLDLVFLGDSLTQRWETAPNAWQEFYGHRRAAQMGIDNDGTQQVLWRIDHGTLDGVRPRLIVLLIGINNLGNDEATAEEVRDGVAAIIQRLRMKLPETKVLLIGLLPYDRPGVDYAERIPGVNRLLAGLADGKTVHFLDIGQRLLIDGRVHADHQPDGAHLSEKGYAIYGEAIEAKVCELLEER